MPWQWQLSSFLEKLELQLDNIRQPVNQVKTQFCFVGCCWQSWWHRSRNFSKSFAKLSMHSTPHEDASGIAALWWPSSAHLHRGLYNLEWPSSALRTILCHHHREIDRWPTIDFWVLLGDVADKQLLGSVLFIRGLIAFSIVCIWPSILWRVSMVITWNSVTVHS